MPMTYRYNHACTTMGNAMYCGGGTDNLGNILASFELFVPGSGWSTLASMPLGYSSFAMATLNNKIYSVGGYNGSSAQSNASVYSAGTWSNITSMTTARSGLGVAAGPDGRLYAAGGDAGDDTTTIAQDSVEAFSPGLNRWVTLTTKMSDKRYDFGMTTGADGRIYAIGGFNGVPARINFTDAYGPDLHLSSTTPAVGSTLTITGNNLAPNARVTVTFDGTVVTTSTSDQFGGLNATSFPVPNVPSGGHSVVVVDHRSRYPITLYLTIP
jgi:N-acetylneuraminic acid mutarotase